MKITLLIVNAAAAIGFVAGWCDHPEPKNERGYIRCVNGHLEAGNIDFEGIQKPVLNYEACIAAERDVQ